MSKIDLHLNFSLRDWNLSPLMICLGQGVPKTKGFLRHTDENKIGVLLAVEKTICKAGYPLELAIATDCYFPGWEFFFDLLLECTPVL